MRRCLFAAVFVLCLHKGMLYAQTPESCLTLAHADDTNWVNQDSVLLDTCSSSATYNEYYAKKWYSVVFDDYLIDVPWSPNDSVVEVSWQAVDTTFDSTRTVLQQLENTFGSYVLRKRSPEDTLPNVAESRYYKIRFTNYVFADSVMAILRLLPKASIAFESKPRALLSVNKQYHFQKLSATVDRDFLVFQTAIVPPISGTIFDIRALPVKRFTFGAIANEYTVFIGNLQAGSYFLMVGPESYKFLKK